MLDALCQVLETGKLQIACRYALSALSHIEDVVPADRQRAIRQALAQVAKLR